MKRLPVIVILWLTALQAWSQQLPMRLWYNRPAKVFEESLPLGNGKLGALVYGSPDDNVIYLNDITFWSGKPVNPDEGGDAYKWIPKIREALFREDYKAADSLQLHVQGPNSSYYMPLGTLHITDRTPGSYSGYRRQLSLDSAVCTDSYVRNGVTYRRTYFVSHPDKAIVIRIEAGKPGALNFEVALTSQVHHTVKASGKQLTLTGNAAGDPMETVHFCSMLRVNPEGGEVRATDSTLVVSGASRAEIYIVNETSFNGALKHPVREGAPYLERVTDEAWHLVNCTYEELLQRHVEDYQSIFGRVKLHLDGSQANTSIPTDSLLHAYGSNTAHDKYLETLYFQYGRYLLISCSRTPNVPANLQGLWNIYMRAPWRSNYTVNINLEENYWPCDVANMPEMFQPLSSFVGELSQTGRHNAWHYYGINQGWCSSHNADLWAMSNPVGEKHESPEWSNWNMGGAWLSQNLYDHYLYTQDEAYLRDTCYPLLKGASEFMLQWLIPNPKKPDELITAPSTSPENEYKTDKGYHGTTCYGGTADLAIIRELFNNTIDAATRLKVDRDFRKQLSEAVSKLHPYTIGHMGDINEWYYDWDDWDFKHRHQSHLIGLYPGSQITVTGTPELAKAATRSLEIKGDYTTGWSTGWRINLWARLKRPDKAYKLYQNLLSYVNPAHQDHGGTFPNLFDAHPPFQIDGNFGGTAGVCEMLMQSTPTTIELLPALPQPWQSGEIQGLVARGGFTVSFSWQNGKVTKVSLSSKQGGKTTLRYNGQEQKIKLRKGQTLTKVVE